MSPQEPSPPVSPLAGGGPKKSLAEMNISELTLLFLNLGIFSQWISLKMEEHVPAFNKEGWISGLVLAVAGYPIHGPGELGGLFGFFQTSFLNLMSAFYPSFSDAKKRTKILSFLTELQRFTVDDLTDEKSELLKQNLKRKLQNALSPFGLNVFALPPLPEDEDSVDESTTTEPMQESVTTLVEALAPFRVEGTSESLEPFAPLEPLSGDFPQVALVMGGGMAAAVAGDGPVLPPSERSDSRPKEELTLEVFVTLGAGASGYSGHSGRSLGGEGLEDLEEGYGGSGDSSSPEGSSESSLLLPRAEKVSKAPDGGRGFMQGRGKSTGPQSPTAPKGSKEPKASGVSASNPFFKGVKMSRKEAKRLRSAGRGAPAPG
jgi:hypothetical protein